MVQMMNDKECNYLNEVEKLLNKTTIWGARELKLMNNLDQHKENYKFRVGLIHEVTYNISTHLLPQAKNC